MKLTKTKLAIGIVAVLTVATTTAMAANPFSDVPSGIWYDAPTQWADETGLTNGCGDGTIFCPENNVTRAQNITFQYRYHINVIEPLLDDITADIATLQSDVGSIPTTHLVRVDSDGTLLQSNNASVTTTRTSTGTYSVDFGGADISNCYWSATVAVSHPFSPNDLHAMVNQRFGAGLTPLVDEVLIAVVDTTDTTTDARVDLIIHC